MILALLACSGAPTPPATVAPALAPAPVHDAIYLAMVDRFRDAQETDHEVNPSDPQGWHGGDLKGVIADLDRLEALGIRQIWLTPLQAEALRLMPHPLGEALRLIPWRMNPVIARCESALTNGGTTASHR